MRSKEELKNPLLQGNLKPKLHSNLLSSGSRLSFTMKRSNDTHLKNLSTLQAKCLLAGNTKQRLNLISTNLVSNERTVTTTKLLPTGNRKILENESSIKPSLFNKSLTVETSGQTGLIRSSHDLLTQRNLKNTKKLSLPQPQLFSKDLSGTSLLSKHVKEKEGLSNLSRNLNNFKTGNVSKEDKSAKEVKRKKRVRNDRTQESNNRRKVHKQESVSKKEQVDQRELEYDLYFAKESKEKELEEHLKAEQKNENKEFGPDLDPGKILRMEKESVKQKKVTCFFQSKN